jgi:predicted RNA binding protein YcfA (HicA-like mRNA interferase family)
VSKLKPIRPDRLIKVLERLGFVQLRQSGSHVILRHQDGRWTTVPMHKGKEVAKGTLAKVIKDAGLSYEEFADLN